MAIAAFPAALVPIIQQGWLERAFYEPLTARLGYRDAADQENFPNNVGQTVTKTRRGLKLAVTTPLNPAANTGLDNGLTSGSWGIEQYTLGIDQYGDTIDLNTVTEGVGIADQAMQNAAVNAEQAGRSIDILARNALFGGGNVAASYGGYLGGNTRVATTLSAAATTLHVDDIRGFQYVASATGIPTAVSAATPMTVTVGVTVYTLVNTAADGTNISTAPNGISGTLTFSANVSVADGTTGNAVVASTAPTVIRAGGAATTAAITSSGKLTMNNVLQATAALRMNNVPTIDGFYHCYLDDSQLLGLFSDEQFMLLYRGEYGADAPRNARIIVLMGIKFITTNLAPQQASLGAGAIHRAFVCGRGALVEGNYIGMRQEAMNAAGAHDDNASISVVRNVVHITRAPLDRLAQIIAQSWYYIGGFALPSDVTANAQVIPTASNSYLKRGVVIESLGAI